MLAAFGAESTEGDAAMLVAKYRGEDLSSRREVFGASRLLESLRKQGLLLGVVSNNVLSEQLEKLEFLGDSVLGLVVCEYLYSHLAEKSEGELARIKSFVVSENSLEIVGRDLKVENFILIGRGEEYSGGRTKRAIIADCMEAVFGAYYLDSGFRGFRL